MLTFFYKEYRSDVVAFDENIKDGVKVQVSCRVPFLNAKHTSSRFRRFGQEK